MTSVSTHVLDTATGEPAEGISVTVERSVDGGWQHMSEGVTDVNGRITMLAAAVISGVYRLVFATSDAGNVFYPQVHIVVSLDEEQDHYHIPLLLSPYGYTTYRGN
ncbi:MAG: hydroxyisourate hydrolase [Acidimicrobiia bacterium]